MEFFRQEYWSGLPFPPPGDLPNSGAESTFPVSCITGGFFTTEPPGKPLYKGQASEDFRLCGLYSLSCNYSTLLLYTVLRQQGNE